MSNDIRANAQDPGAERAPPQYALAAYSRPPAPPGWMFVVNQDDVEGKPLLLSVPAGKALIAWSKQVRAEFDRLALDALGLDTSGRDRPPPGPLKAVQPASGRAMLGPRPSCQIPVPDESVLNPPMPTTGGPWVRIWGAEAFMKIIERHNAGEGSADKADRERNAAAWQAQIDAGPWRPCAIPADPDLAVAELRAELGHMHELCELIEERLVLAQSEGTPFTLPPILLVGRPGVGKSYAAHRVAKLLGLPVELVDMSCQQTNSRLHGSDKHWSNATPGLLRQLVVGGPVANPVVVLEELDKVTRLAGSRYDPMAPLHTALEPGTARVTEDLCIAGVFDASRVIYFATANTLRPIPDSLLSRFRLVHCTAPGARQALVIAQRIARELTSDHAGFAPASRAVIAALADRTPRQIQKLLESAIARAVTSGRRHLELRDLDGEDCGSRPLH